MQEGRQVIPEAAVEAAGQALRDAFDWGVTDFDKQAHAALEAAASHMLAEAWDEGSIAGWVESGLPHSWHAENSLRNSNPYRTAK